MGYRVPYIYIYPFILIFITCNSYLGFHIINLIDAVCIYTLIISLIIHAIGFKYFKSNLHCFILAQISVLIPILVCMGLGFFGLSGNVFELGFFCSKLGYVSHISGD